MINAMCMCRCLLACMLMQQRFDINTIIDSIIDRCATVCACMLGGASRCHSGALANDDAVVTGATDAAQAPTSTSTRQKQINASTSIGRMIALLGRVRDSIHDGATHTAFLSYPSLELSRLLKYAMYVVTSSLNIHYSPTRFSSYV